MTNPTPTPQTSHRRATTLLGAVLPLGILAGASVIASTWRAELPDPVATHWGTRGPDGYSSFTNALLVPAAIGAVTVLVFWLIGFFWGQAAATRRIVVGASVGVALLIAVIIVGSLNAQRGLADATQVGGIGGSITLALIAATLVGIGAGFLTPGDAHMPTTAKPPSSASRIPLGPDERAVWIRTSSKGPGSVIGLLTIVGTTILAISTSDWWLLFLPVFLAGVFASMFHWTVRVDAAGLSVRSLLGFPRTLIPLDEIEVAQIVEIHALREFGGWGWRVGRDGRTGVVLRSGEALEVTRTGGRQFVVTVQDAAVAAALLNTLATASR